MLLELKNGGKSNTQQGCGRSLAPGNLRLFDLIRLSFFPGFLNAGEAHTENADALWLNISSTPFQHLLG